MPAGPGGGRGAGRRGRRRAAIAEWAADADEQTLSALEVAGRVPSESTFRRTLQRLDADAFDVLAGAWAAQATTPGPGRRRSSRWTARLDRIDIAGAVITGDAL